MPTGVGLRGVGSIRYAAVGAVMVGIITGSPGTPEVGPVHDTGGKMNAGVVRAVTLRDEQLASRRRERTLILLETNRGCETSEIDVVARERWAAALSDGKQ